MAIIFIYLSKPFLVMDISTFSSFGTLDWNRIHSILEFEIMITIYVSIDSITKSICFLVDLVSSKNELDFICLSGTRLGKDKIQVDHFFIMATSTQYTWISFLKETRLQKVYFFQNNLETVLFGQIFSKNTLLSKKILMGTWMIMHIHMLAGNEELLGY